MEERINQLVIQAKEQQGEKRLELLEEASRLSEVVQSEDKSYHLLFTITELALNLGKGEKAVASFDRLLEKLDRYPESFNQTETMWLYKKVLERLDQFPNMEREEVEERLEDFYKRLAALGMSTRSYHLVKHLMAKRRGDYLQAQINYEDWQEEAPDDHIDCPACDLHHEISYLLVKGRLSKAYEMARPILEGEMTCPSVPHHTVAELLMPLLEAKRYGEAQKLHHRFYLQIQNKQGYLFAVASHIRYLSVVDREKAHDLLLRHQQEAEESKEIYDKYQFYLSRYHLENLLRYEDDMELDEEKCNEVREEMNDLSDEIDRRNRNNFVSNQIRGLRYQIERIQKNIKKEIQEIEELYTSELGKDIEYELHRRLSKASNGPDAMYRLGMSYLTGTDCEVDLAVAEKWLVRAAEVGHIRAMCLLGLEYLYGVQLEPNPGQAAKWLRLVAESGDPDYMMIFGYNLSEGNGMIQDIVEGTEWLRKAAEAGNPPAQYRFGVHLLEGIGVERDLEASEMWLRRAAENGSFEAMNSLALCFWKGGPLVIRKEEAIGWLYQAVEGGDHLAMFYLATRLLDGDQLPKDQVEGEKWLRKAAEENIKALLSLACRLLDGNGLEKNVAEGELLLRRAAKNGGNDAKCELGLRLMNGDGLAEDVTEATYWFEQMAQAGHPKGMLYYGLCLTLTNMQEAKIWIRGALEAGVQEAQEWLDELAELE